MKILAISDVVSWGYLKSTIKKENPDAIFLLGDLTQGSIQYARHRINKGMISFPLDNVDEFNGYAKWERFVVEEENGIRYVYEGHEVPNSFYEEKGVSYVNVDWKKIGILDEDYEKYFEKNNGKKYIKIFNESFYDALEFCNEQEIETYILQGNHDMAWTDKYLNSIDKSERDYCFNYNIDRLESYLHIHEVSGKLFTVEDLKFMGLSYEDTHYLTKLRPTILNMSHIDGIITHSTRARINLLCDSKNPYKYTKRVPPLEFPSNRKPFNFIIAGHSGWGIMLRNDVPVFYTGAFPMTYLSIVCEDSLVSAKFIPKGILSDTTWRLRNKRQNIEEMKNDLYYHHDVVYKENDIVGISVKRNDLFEECKIDHGKVIDITYPPYYNHTEYKILEDQ